MLYTATVEPVTLELLTQLMRLPMLNAFALAGGTNLALRFGHRLSVDLDLFTNHSFSEQAIADELITIFPTAVKTDQTKNTLSFSIQGVKVDLLAHRYPLLGAFTTIADVRFWAVEDVVAMKLGAVSGRGAKKDFWDVAELLRYYSLAQMLECFSAKYANSDPGYVIRSLTYFDDAESQIDPIVLDGTTWTQVKQRVVKAVKELI